MSDVGWVNDNSPEAAQELAVGHLIGQLSTTMFNDQNVLDLCHTDDQTAFWSEVARVNEEMFNLLLDHYGYTKLELWEYIRVT